MSGPYPGHPRFPVRVVRVAPGGGVTRTTGVSAVPASPYALPFVPDTAAVADPQSGVMTRPWAQFLRRLVGIAQSLADAVLALQSSATGWVTGPASAVSGDLASYSGATGKTIADSGIPLGQVARKDQSNLFTVTAQTIQAVSPYVALIDPSQPADQRYFRLLNTGGICYLQALNDAQTSSLGYVSFSRTGGLNVSGAIGSPGGYYESNRGTPLGYWIDVPFSASNYGNMTVSASNVVTQAYTLVGKTLLFAV